MVLEIVMVVPFPSAEVQDVMETRELLSEGVDRVRS
jgi:hypothetical protein